jgi:DNA ligase-1
MIRDPNGPYKAGRSTLKEGYLLKLKRFVDAEAEVVGYQELFHNANEATTNVFGRTERSGHRENMIPMGMLGALTVRGINGTYKDRVFNVGTGYDEATRIQLWKERGTLAGRIITYRFQEIGSKDKPRVPTWQGFRDPADQ